MNITISTKNFDHTPSIDEMIKKKTAKLEKFLDANATLKWTCHNEGSDKSSELHIISKGTEYYAKATEKDLYKTFDEVINKIQSQISHQH